MLSPASPTEVIHRSNENASPPPATLTPLATEQPKAVATTLTQGEARRVYAFQETMRM